MKLFIFLLLGGALLVGAAEPAAPLPVVATPWAQILGPTRSVIPAAASGPVVWRTNLTIAMFEAKQENRPLFITIRCLPCKQCADFDKEVLEGGADLDPWLRHFITVRITDAATLDLRMFPLDGFQDLDVSWWGWFFSPMGQVYGVTGGRDHISDSTRISKAALINTLQRVVAHHYDPRRVLWDVDGPEPMVLGTPFTARNLAGYAAWQRNYATNQPVMDASATPPPAFNRDNLAAYKEWTQRSKLPTANGPCLHCHQVNDIFRQPALDAKLFNKQRHVEVWPLPENVGLTLERDHGLLVTSVTPGSPAAKTGLQTGDVLGAAAGRQLFSQTDFRGVLQRGPLDAGEFEVWWLRNNAPMSGKLVVAPGWRKTVLDWRMSLSQGNIGAPPGFFPLANVSEARRAQLGLKPDVMAVTPFWGGHVNALPARAGLRQTDVITAVDGQSPNLGGRAFLIWFRQNHEAGEPVTFTIRDLSGAERKVTYELVTTGF